MARRRSRRARSIRRPARRRRRTSAGPWILVLVLAALAIWLTPRVLHRSGARAPAPPRFAPEQADALADSIDVATFRNDFSLALTYALDLARLAPHVSGAQTKLSAAWHNYATASRTLGGVSRSARRTSIDKIACEIRAMAAADSARQLARNDTEWLAASDVYARTLEYLGLPVDALTIYRQMLRIDSTYPNAVSRVHSITERLRNPVSQEPL